jgi:hypothetical protein
LISSTFDDADGHFSLWLAALSCHARHQLACDSSHYIQFDRPDVVVFAVNEVVSEVCTSSKSVRRLL